MRLRGGIAAVLGAAAIATALTGCGPQHQPVASTPEVTVPTPTGPALTAAALRAKAGAACTVLYRALNAAGDPPTDDPAKAATWYPQVAAAWHRFLASVAPLVPPADQGRDWGDVVENTRKITTDADANVALQKAGREPIELINSDPTADQGTRGLSNGELLNRLGITACTGG